MSIFDKDGRSDPLTCANKQIEVLQEKLAKADERVKELEKESLAFRSILDQSNRFHPNTDKMYSSGFKDAMRLFEDIYLGDAQQALNKFAIAKKVEALDEVESVYMQAAETSEPISFREAFDAVEEQLRKEQE